ncbi:unnamed protein product [Protopolystoma xenopodis]|uniref:Uncharacterized protein n=1 Tax=Protopolystoma xenopodis TaxID=117903 RepID=A0A448XA60_9PLAT|nr:unnamed protein product [Protopolystoma xenopodis]
MLGRQGSQASHWYHDSCPNTPQPGADIGQAGAVSTKQTGSQNGEWTGELGCHMYLCWLAGFCTCEYTFSDA